MLIYSMLEAIISGRLVSQGDEGKPGAKSLNSILIYINIMF